MNKQRRKDLDKVLSLLEDAKNQLELTRDEEQDAYDSMPEGIQNGDRGEAAQEAVNSLEEAISSIDDIVSNIESAKGE